MKRKTFLTLLSLLFLVLPTYVPASVHSDSPLTQVTERWGLNRTATHTTLTMDAEINAVWPNEANGTGERLVLRAAPGYAQGALLYFDVSNLPPNTTVHKALLRLWLISETWVDAYEPIYQIGDPDGLGLWEENEVTFNSRRSGVPWSLQAPGTITTVLTADVARAYVGHLRFGLGREKWVEWDITSAVRDWVAHPERNQGLYLPPLENGLYYVAASTFPQSDKRPYLQITYEGVNPNRPPQPTELRVFFRSGQTFITWREIHSSSAEEAYRIYRHTEPITADNIDQARLLAEIPRGSSYYKREAEQCLHYDGIPGHCSPIHQTRYIIEDGGRPLDPDQGLFVYTVHEEGDFYYAVTSVVEGNENRLDFSQANATRVPLHEYEAPPRPVVVWQSPDGLRRVITQFMDYQAWNPAFEGYAYNTYIGLPAGYDPETSPPLPLVLGPMHGWGGIYRAKVYNSHGGTDQDWPVIQVIPDDRNRTWWYGFGEYVNHPRPLREGRIVNYTERRLLQLIQWLIDDPYFKVDTNRIYMFGESMGGSVGMSFAFRHPELFAAVYAGEPVSNYRTSGWTYATSLIWGRPEENIPTVEGVGVYDWLDSQAWAADWNNEGAFLVVQHGRKDIVVPWETQTLRLVPALEGGRKGYIGYFNETGHNWDGFVDTPNFTFHKFNFLKNESFPAFGHASNSVDPARSAGCRNCLLEWSSSANNFAGPPVDTSERYEIVLRNRETRIAYASVTPRRLQSFHPEKGRLYHWKNIRLDTGEILQEGETRAYGKGLITVDRVMILPEGNRLIIEPVPLPTPTPTPSPTPPPATPTPTPPPSPTPTVTPTPTPPVTPERIFIPTLFTGERVKHKW